MALNIGKGLFSADEDIYGKKPIVPQYDPFGSYQKTIKENIALAPEAMKLADITNQYNLGTRTGLFEQLRPGYSGMLGQVAQNQDARIRGEISPDALGLLARQGAAWRQDSGVGGGGMGNFRDLRNFGRASMDVQRQGESDAANWLRTLTQTSLPDAVDIRDYSINPASRLSEDFNRDWLAAQVTASPDPAKRGQFDSKMAILGMMLSAYGGGAGYQGTYRPSYGNNNFGYGGEGGAAGGGGGWWSRMTRPSYAPQATPTNQGFDYNPTPSYDPNFSMFA